MARQRCTRVYRPCTPRRANAQGRGQSQVCATSGHQAAQPSVQVRLSKPLTQSLNQSIDQSISSSLGRQHNQHTHPPSPRQLYSTRLDTNLAHGSHAQTETSGGCAALEVMMHLHTTIETVRRACTASRFTFLRDDCTKKPSPKQPSKQSTSTNQPNNNKPTNQPHKLPHRQMSTVRHLVYTGKQKRARTGQRTTKPPTRQLTRSH